MRKLLITALALSLLAASYIAYPFLTAWSIREAILGGRSAYLESKIEWDSVRTTLRRSLARPAFDAPDASANQDQPVAARPGMWKRLMAYVGRSAADRLIDRYVTPEGLPQIYAYRKLYRQHVSGEPDEATLAWHVRLARFWSRLKRAEFKSPTKFEVEMADRYDARRHYVGLLELRGLEWKLTELSVQSADGTAPPAIADEDAEADADEGPPSRSADY